MPYCKAKLKSSGVRASPCFRPFWIGKLSGKCLLVCDETKSNQLNPLITNPEKTKYT
jgi:hypothetical protein